MKTVKLTREEKIAKELKLSLVDEYGTNEVEQFVSTAKQYLKAIKEGRMICSIGSVSKSGMSRTIKFLSCEPISRSDNHYYRNYYLFFKQMGFGKANDRDYFRINGCGMDMIFHTNYTIVYKLCSLGLINETQRNELCQKTPEIV